MTNGFIVKVLSVTITSLPSPTTAGENLAPLCQVLNRTWTYKCFPGLRRPIFTATFWNILAILGQYFDNTFKKYSGLGGPPPTNLAMEPHQWVGHRRTFAGRTFISCEVSMAFGFSIFLLFILTSFKIYNVQAREPVVSIGGNLSTSSLEIVFNRLHYDKFCETLVLNSIF